VDKRDAAAAVAEGTMRIECLLYARCSELLQTRGKLGSIGLRTPPCPAAAAAMHCCQGPSKGLRCWHNTLVHLLNEDAMLPVALWALKGAACPPEETLEPKQAPATSLLLPTVNCSCNEVFEEIGAETPGQGSTNS
jgi:hypothetical protein